MKQRELRIEVVPFDQIKTVAWNPRKDLRPGDPEYEKIRRSLNEFGYIDPLVWNARSGNLCGGHQRLKIMKAAGMTQAQVSVVDLDEDQEALLNIALNRVHGSDDIPKLKEVVFELEGKGVDVTVSGIDMDELARLLNRDQEPTSQDDEVPEGVEERAAPGQLWELGAHLMFVGDAIKPEAYAALGLDAHAPACVFTDPPYGVSYEARSGKFEVIEGDRKRDDALLAMLTDAFKHAAKAARPDAAWYIWHASATRRDFEDALRAAGLVERQYLIWAKENISLGHADYRWAHEPCFYASAQDHRPAFYGDRAQPTVWTVTTYRKAEAATVLAGGLVLTDGRGRELYLSPKVPRGKKARKVRLENGGGNQKRRSSSSRTAEPRAMSGAFPTTGRRNIRHKNPWSSPCAPSATAARRARSCSICSPAAGPRSSRPRSWTGARAAWSSTPDTRASS